MPRYTAIAKKSAVKMTIENGPSPAEARSQPLHPKDKSVGSKPVMYGRELYIEADDAKTLTAGQKVTLMKWGNATVTRIEESKENGLHVYATVDEEDKNFKGTVKLTWICADPDSIFELKIVEFDHLITKEKVEDEDDIAKIFNQNSRFEYTAIAEGVCRNLKQGSFFQFERRGFYYVDKIGLVGQQMTVNFVPDGKTKAMSAVGHAVDAKETAKGKAAGGKTAEKETGKGPDGKISKKQAAKDAKKAAKKAGKPLEKGTQNPGAAGKKPQAKPAAAASTQSAPVQ